MADKVQLKLERMIPDLDALLKIGIFKKNEVKNIIKKRRFYEYQLEKTDVSKSDFFKAIRYEKLLDKRRIGIKKEKTIKKIETCEFSCIILLISSC